MTKGFNQSYRFVLGHSSFGCSDDRGPIEAFIFDHVHRLVKYVQFRAGAIFASDAVGCVPG